jgi:hypothetical protein
LKPPTLPDLRLSNHQAAAVVYPIRLRRFDLSSKRALSGSQGFHPLTIFPKSLTAFLSSLRFFTRIHSHHPESMKSGFQPAMLAHPSRDQEAQNSPLLSCSVRFSTVLVRTNTWRYEQNTTLFVQWQASLSTGFFVCSGCRPTSIPAKGSKVIDNYTIKLSPRPRRLRAWSPSTPTFCHFWHPELVARQEVLAFRLEQLRVEHSRFRLA